MNKDMKRRLWAEACPANKLDQTKPDQPRLSPRVRKRFSFSRGPNLKLEHWKSSWALRAVCRGVVVMVVATMARCLLLIYHDD